MARMGRERGFKDFWEKADREGAAPDYRGRGTHSIKTLPGMQKRRAHDGALSSESANAVGSKVGRSLICPCPTLTSEA